MEPTTLNRPQDAENTHTQPGQTVQGPADEAPRLDLSRMEPPKRLEEARLEEVTIDGICGVY